MLAFRIADRRHAIFDGSGAMLKGGRWNSPGTPVIYAAETYAGAVLEIVVHANLGYLPKTHSSICISLPDDLALERLQPSEVPGWDAEDRVASRAHGDLWLDERRTAILTVPSVILHGRENNILINPNHPDFHRLEADAPKLVVWDPRLFSRTL